MDRRTEPPIWPPDESEIPEENEIDTGKTTGQLRVSFFWWDLRS
jgi:hypothetical protein